MDHEPIVSAPNISRSFHSDQSPSLLRPMTSAALLRRLIFASQSLFDLETCRRPYSRQTARRHERHLEVICSITDELARRY